MFKYLLIFSISLIVPQFAYSNGFGAGTCDVVGNLSNIFMSRTKNPNPGSYSVASNLTEYTAGTPVELTVSGPTFTGIMFNVVDENGQKVGTFDTVINQVTSCQGNSNSVTHSSSFGNVTTHTLFWIPPATDVGTIYVLGYVLSGSRGNQAAQQFYRFVRDDGTAISLDAAATAEVPIFKNGFESLVFN